MNAFPTLGSPHSFYVPSLIGEIGEHAAKAFLEFFAADIRNPQTRDAYLRAVRRFCEWCDSYNLRLEQVEPFHVGAYVEAHSKEASAPTVKQHLAAIRRLLDFLVMQRVISSNPAKAVRGVKYVVKKGKTPIPSVEETRELLASIPTDSLMGLRDRALIGVLLYSFARVSAALAMRVEDYYPQGKRWWLRLHEKGGKYHEMPVHYKLEEYLDAYIEAGKFAAVRKAPLFRSAKRNGALTQRAMCRQDAYYMIQQRARVISTKISCHSFRARGITSYLENGGLLEHAQVMAAHASPETTKLYDRTGDAISLDEIEKIVF
jgi:site-specific recombinase XerD